MRKAIKYQSVVVGGTFDDLHKGHKIVLTRAFAEGKKVTIGLTSDKYVARFKEKQGGLKIKTFQKRKQNLENWLKSRDYLARARIVSIDDPVGPAATDDFDALIVTRQNKDRGEEINRRRKEKGLAPVRLIEVPMVKASDGKLISSTRVKNGEIDKNGRLVMPEALRPLLRQPLGPVIAPSQVALAQPGQKKKIIVTVGDVATEKLLERGIVPALAIVDFYVGRRPYPRLESKLNCLKLTTRRVKSGPGYIGRAAVDAIKIWSRQVGSEQLRTNTVIIVDGEEDLLALPAIIHAPAGSMVYYGQPSKGLVEVRITESARQKADKLLRQFK